MQKNYHYTYNIIKIELFESKERRIPIARYSSNAAPPQIGSTINLVSFVEEKPREYMVVGVEILPLSFDELRQTSDETVVAILVKKIEP